MEIAAQLFFSLIFGVWGIVLFRKSRKLFKHPYYPATLKIPWMQIQMNTRRLATIKLLGSIISFLICIGFLYFAYVF